MGGKERRGRVQEEKVKGQIDCAQKKARRPLFFSCSPQLADATTAESLRSQFHGHAKLQEGYSSVEAILGADVRPRMPSPAGASLSMA